jgi:alkanesulfonate monooxygenase SsuD/methylene tetrahydromethanopterin reductase-like flavin-dependent oxidoreductase (luciferase family)
MDVSIVLDARRPWAEILGLAQAADGSEAYAVYVCDHFMAHTDDPKVSGQGVLESMTVLAALAPLTSRVRLGPLVLGAAYRHPAVVANQLTGLDHVSGGRVVAGLGAGWQPNEHLAYGIDLLPPGARSDRFEEYVAVVSSLLHQPRTSFSGDYFTLQDATNVPGPLQSRLPVLIGGDGEKRTIPTAAHFADAWHCWGTPQDFRAKSEKLAAACVAIDRDPAEVRRVTGYAYGPRVDLAAELEPYRLVCDEFVVVDWASRPLQATIDDLKRALT